MENAATSSATANRTSSFATGGSLTAATVRLAWAVSVLKSATPLVKTLSRSVYEKPAGPE